MKINLQTIHILRFTYSSIILHYSQLKSTTFDANSEDHQPICLCNTDNSIFPWQAKEWHSHDFYISRWRKGDIIRIHSSCQELQNSVRWCGKICCARSFITTHTDGEPTDTESVSQWSMFICQLIGDASILVYVFYTFLLFFWKHLHTCLIVLLKYKRYIPLPSILFLCPGLVRILSSIGDCLWAIEYKSFSTC